MTAFFLETALLPDGWARNVRLDVEGGAITHVSAGGLPDGAERIGGLVLPGLPNLHSHTFQRGMAGLAETRGEATDSFWTWRQVMYRFLDRLTPDDVEAIAAFAFMEMLESGSTAVAEFHYLHHAADGSAYADIAELSGRIAAAAAAAGIGLTLLPVFYAHGGFGGRAPDPGQRRFINDLDGFARLHEAARRHVAALPGAAIGIAPHSLRAATPDELHTLLAVHEKGPVHIHVAEQVREVEDCLAWSGRRPVEWLLGEIPVDSRWCLVHATHMTPGETRAMAQSGAVAGLCPLTEANLGDGIFPGSDFAAAGGRWGVGSDSNVEFGAAAELKQLEYSQRLSLRQRNVLAAAPGASTGLSLYRAALAGGAQALGRAIGAIAPGQRCDLVSLDASHPSLAGIAEPHWLDAYVFVAGKAMIDRVVAGGKTLVLGGRHLGRESFAARYAQTLRKVLE